MGLNLDKKIPVAMRNEFWTAVMLSIEDEILLMRKQMETKKTLYSFKATDLERLKELADLIYEIDYNALTSIESLLENNYGISEEMVEIFLRKELIKIPYQTLNKTLYSAYKGYFSFLSFSFNHYISVYHTTSLFDLYTGNTIIVRDLQDNLLANIEDNFESYSFTDDDSVALTDSSYSLGYDSYYSTILDQKVTNNFLGKISLAPTLDTDGVTLDDSEVTSLDLEPTEIKNSTKHISFEAVADQTFVRYDNGTYNRFLMPADALAYMNTGFFYNRKAVEVSHIGVQLSFFVDNSGFDNFLNSDLSDLYSAAVVNPSVLAEGVYSSDQIVSIKFGASQQEVPEYTDEEVTYPTELAYPVYTSYPLSVEKYDTTSVCGAIGLYNGQAVGGFPFTTVAFGYGITSFTDIPIITNTIAPIRPNTLKLAIVDSTAVNPLATMKRITDDGHGNLVSDYCSGTVDYTKATISFTTTFNKVYKDSISFESSSYSATFIESIIPSTFALVLKFEDDSTYYYIKDDGDGNLYSDYENFDSGTITYEVSPKIEVTFKESIDVSDESFITYKYVYSADLATTDYLYLYEVYTKNVIRITEAGLYVRTAVNPTIDQLLVYMKFPIVEFTSNYYHLNLGVAFEK